MSSLSSSLLRVPGRFISTIPSSSSSSLRPSSISTLSRSSLLSSSSSSSSSSLLSSSPFVRHFSGGHGHGPSSTPEDDEKYGISFVELEPWHKYGAVVGGK